MRLIEALRAMIADPSHVRTIEQRIGYKFKDKSLLIRALTHRSYATDNNQRLEFLGDAVMGMILAEILYDDPANLEEGEMTRRRAMLICGPALVDIARNIGLSECLILGESEDTSSGRNRPSTLEDAIEAIVGAVYLDGGLKSARKVVVQMFGKIEERIVRLNTDHNPKGRLQEITQAMTRRTAVKYRLISITGQTPHQEFLVEVVVDGTPMGRGKGGSKKKAEEEAARQALARLGNGAQ